MADMLSLMKLFEETKQEINIDIPIISEEAADNIAALADELLSEAEPALKIDPSSSPTALGTGSVSMQGYNESNFSKIVNHIWDAFHKHELTYDRAQAMLSDLGLDQHTIEGLLESITEARLDDPNVSYEPDKKGEKIVAVLKSHKSAVFTKLALKVEKLKALETEIEDLRKEVQTEARGHIAELFDADDAIKTRVVQTMSLIITLSKVPKPTTTYKYAKIVEELSENLTPELLTMLEALKKKYKTVTQKEPSLSIDMNEGIGDMFVGLFHKFKQLVNRWAIQYDKKLETLAKMV